MPISPTPVSSAVNKYFLNCESCWRASIIPWRTISSLIESLSLRAGRASITTARSSGTAEIDFLRIFQVPSTALAIAGIADGELGFERFHANRVWILWHRNETHAGSGFQSGFHCGFSTVWGLRGEKRIIPADQRQNAHTRKRGAIVGHRLGH